jgi:hypothetical protein
MRGGRWPDGLYLPPRSRGERPSGHDEAPPPLFHGADGPDDQVGVDRHRRARAASRRAVDAHEQPERREAGGSRVILMPVRCSLPVAPVTDGPLRRAGIPLPEAAGLVPPCTCQLVKRARAAEEEESGWIR